MGKRLKLSYGSCGAARLACLAVLFAVTGPVKAAVPNSTTFVVSACFKSTGSPLGAIRVIDRQAGAKCATGEKLLEWKASSIRCRGAWNPTATYLPNDVVVSDGAAFIAKLGSKGVPTSTLASWGLLAAKGAIGPAGPAGAQGIPGETGEKGEPGEKGDQGDKGDTGLAGAEGDKGDTGATGAVGPTGVVQIVSLIGESGSDYADQYLRFFGGTETVTLTAGQRLTGSVVASVKGAYVKEFRYTLCYQTLEDEAPKPFQPGAFIRAEVTDAARVPHAASATSPSLPAGEYFVDFCAKQEGPAATDFVPFAGYVSVKGWVMVTN